MALNYGFCLGDLNREYTSEEFSNAINAVFGDGVSEYGMQFSVYVNGFHPSVDSGYAVAAGRYLENDAREALTIYPSSNTEDRTDAIVVRVDHAAREVELAVLEDVDPEAIEQDAGIIRDSTKYCLVLYFIKVRRGVTTLSPDDVTDARGNNAVCGYLKPLSSIAGSILSVYNFVVSGFEQKVAELLQNGEFVIRTGERALAALESVVEERTGFYLGDVVIAVNKPGRSADWLLCDGSPVPEDYPKLSELLEGTLPNLPQTDTRLKAWIFTGAPHPYDGRGEDDMYTVKATVTPASYGDVTGGGTYQQSAEVSLSAKARSGFQFQYWQENGRKISEKSSYSFRLYCDRAIAAVFEAIYRITLSASPSGAGTLSGSGTYKRGTNATVRAAPGTWYRFVEWRENNAAVSSSASYTFTVDRERSLVALFAELAVARITATVSPAGSGTVTGAGTYKEGDSVQLSASTSNVLNKFSEWQENGATVSRNAKYVFTAATDRALVALFDVLRVPAGYTELQYITTTYATGIEVDVPVSPSRSRVVLDTSLLEVLTSEITMIFRGGGDTYYDSPVLFLFQNKSSTKYVYKAGANGIGSGTEFSYTTQTGQRITIDMDPVSRRLVMGEENITLSVGPVSGNCKIFGFGTIIYENVVGNPAGLPQRIYGASIYNDGVLAGEYVPCKNSAGKVGLYNRITHKFCINANTSHSNSEPIAGPAV